ncbi:MAG: hypothetical protein IT350_10240 [Deltaproteobacteria bacterium]|nr:hypothetical protein [Deltaproteobacteria bacterium]
MIGRRADHVAPVAVSALLAAHLAYYIVIVQFALLGHYAGLGLAIDALRVPLGLLTAGGIASAWMTGRRLDRTTISPLALFGSIAVLAIAIGSFGLIGFLLRSVGAIAALFAALGALLGTQIVLLLAAFHTRIPAPARGVYAGGVTAATYLFANLVAGFAPSPEAAGLVCALALAFGVVIVAAFRNALIEAPTHPVCPEPRSIGKTAVAVAPLALLVAVDSFVFYPVGQGDVAAHPVFASAGDWVSNGVWHVVFALIVGVLYAWIGFRRVVAIGAAGMVLAALALLANETGDVTRWVRVCYSFVVGAYTVALVAAPQSIGNARSPHSSIAVVMILAGFVANPIGIGTYLAVGMRLAARDFWLTGVAAATVAYVMALVAARRDNPSSDFGPNREKT